MNVKEVLETFFKQELEVAEKSAALALMFSKQHMVEYIAGIRDRCIQHLERVEEAEKHVEKDAG